MCYTEQLRIAAIPYDVYKNVLGWITYYCIEMHFSLFCRLNGLDVGISSIAITNLSLQSKARNDIPSIISVKHLPCRKPFQMKVKNSAISLFWDHWRSSIWTPSSNRRYPYWKHETIRFTICSMVSQNYISLEAVQDFINNKQEDEENEFADMRLLCAKNEKEPWLMCTWKTHISIRVHFI
jgi:hypothetical protein